MMYKTIRRLFSAACAALLLSLAALLLTACGGPQSADRFEAEYEAVYGQLFELPHRNINARAVNYGVRDGNGDAVTVSGYRFAASDIGGYTVKASFADNNREIAVFFVRVRDTEGPEIVLSYTQRYALVGSSVMLPGVSVYDNRDADIEPSFRLTGSDGAAAAAGGNSFIPSAEGTYTAVYTAADSDGNTAVQTANVYAVAETETEKMDTVVNWTEERGLKELVRAGWNTRKSIVKFGGFAAGDPIYDDAPVSGDAALFRYATTGAVQTNTALMFTGDLADGLTKYQFISFWYYGDFTIPAVQLSYNWSVASYTVNLPVRKWTRILIPVNEKMVFENAARDFVGLQTYDSLFGHYLYFQWGGAYIDGAAYCTDVMGVNYVSPGQNALVDFTLPETASGVSGYTAAESVSMAEVTVSGGKTLAARVTPSQAGQEQWLYGINLSAYNNALAALFEDGKYVKLKFSYYLESLSFTAGGAPVSAALKFSCGGRQSGTDIAAPSMETGAWRDAEFVLSAPPENFIIGIAADSFSVYVAKNMYIDMYISSITYEVIAAPENLLIDFGYPSLFGESVSGVTYGGGGYEAGITDENGYGTLRYSYLTGDQRAYALILNNALGRLKALAGGGAAKVKLTFKYYLNSAPPDTIKLSLAVGDDMQAALIAGRQTETSPQTGTWYEFETTVTAGEIENATGFWLGVCRDDFSWNTNNFVLDICFTSVTYEVLAV